MKEVTYYISDDGMQFTDYYKCREHELDIMEICSSLMVFGAHNKILHKLYNGETYNQSKKIVIPSEEALNFLHVLQDYTGFYCDIPIDKSSIGTWRYKEKGNQYCEYGEWIKDKEKK